MTTKLTKANARDAILRTENEAANTRYEHDLEQHERRTKEYEDEIESLEAKHAWEENKMQTEFRLQFDQQQAKHGVSTTLYEAECTTLQHEINNVREGAAAMVDVQRLQLTEACNRLTIKQEEHDDLIQERNTAKVQATEWRDC